MDIMQSTDTSSYNLQQHQQSNFIQNVSDKSNLSNDVSTNYLKQSFDIYTGKLRYIQDYIVLGVLKTISDENKKNIIYIGDLSPNIAKVLNFEAHGQRNLLFGCESFTYFHETQKMLDNMPKLHMSACKLEKFLTEQLIDQLKRTEKLTLVIINLPQLKEPLFTTICQYCTHFKALVVSTTTMEMTVDPETSSWLYHFLIYLFYNIRELNMWIKKNVRQNEFDVSGPRLIGLMRKLNAICLYPDYSPITTIYGSHTDAMKQIHKSDEEIWKYCSDIAIKNMPITEPRNRRRVPLTNNTRLVETKIEGLPVTNLRYRGIGPKKKNRHNQRPFNNPKQRRSNSPRDVYNRNR